MKNDCVDQFRVMLLAPIIQLELTAIAIVTNQQLWMHSNAIGAYAYQAGTSSGQLR
jgi:hypothetical protein